MAELAESLCVTVRTILRDVETLRADGFQLTGARGRGGGLKLEQEGSIDSLAEPAANLPVPAKSSYSETPRSIFVGRASELKALREVYEDIREGTGRAVVLAGEPGIGKTMLAKEATDEYARQGAMVLWGRCLESEGALPYWPWVQVIRSYANTRSPEQLRDDLGAGAADIGEIVPEIFNWIPDLDHSGPVITPESERFRLFNSVGIFLENASRDQPLVLVLEDLHRADRSSLLLLEFISQQIGMSRILVLGTYRDVELGRRHPLARSLAELNRQPGFVRLSLKGLDEREIGELIERASGSMPDRSLISSLYHQTNGNPLFVSEMALLLLQEGPGSLDHDSTNVPRKYRVPEGIREAIGQRLDRLSPEANEMLRAASVLGREFSVPELRHLLAGLPERAGDSGSVESGTLAMLDEAEQGHLLEDVSGEVNRYQFTHSLIRDTLYQELTALERVRLHQLAGEALEKLYSANIAVRLPQLAHHFLEAARGGHTGKAVGYAEMAGHHAAATVAHDEAVRYFDMALQGLALNQSVEERRRCEILMARGRSQQAAGDIPGARATFTEAFELGERADDRELCAEAAIEFETAGWHPGLHGIPAVRLLRRALEGLPDADSGWRARTLASLGRALNYCGLNEAAVEIGNAAIEMARRLDDPRTLAITLWTRLPTRSDPEDIYERVRLGTEAVQICEELGESDMSVNAEAWLMNDITELGDASRREALYQSWRAKVLRLRDPMWLYNLSTVEVGRTAARGQFEEAERIASAAMQHGQLLRGLDANGIHGAMMFWIRRERGLLHEVKPALELFIEHSQAAVWSPGLATLYAGLGMKEETRAVFDSIAEDDFASLNRDALFTCALAYLTDVCAYLGDAGRAPILYELLKVFEGRNISLGVANVYVGPTARYLGVLATLMCRWEDAERHFEDALEMAGRMEAPTQLAHCMYLYGEMLRRRKGPGDNKRARSMQSEALNRARDLEMRTLTMSASEALIKREVEKPTVSYFPAGLSAREAEVLKLLASGKANREIGEELFITQNTVANHVKSILQKTGAANRTEAAAFAVRNGFVEK